MCCLCDVAITCYYLLHHASSSLKAPLTSTPPFIHHIRYRLTTGTRRITTCLTTGSWSTVSTPTRASVPSRNVKCLWTIRRTNATFAAVRVMFNDDCLPVCAEPIVLRIVYYWTLMSYGCRVTHRVLDTDVSVTYLTYTCINEVYSFSLLSKVPATHIASMMRRRPRRRGKRRRRRLRRRLRRRRKRARRQLRRRRKPKRWRRQPRILMRKILMRRRHAKKLRSDSKRFQFHKDGR